MFALTSTRSPSWVTFTFDNIVAPEICGDGCRKKAMPRTIATAAAQARPRASVRTGFSRSGRLKPALTRPSTAFRKSGPSTIGTDSSRRTNSSSLIAMPSCLQRLAQQLPCGEEARLHRFLRQFQDLRDLVIRKVNEVAEDHHRAIVRLELEDLLVKIAPHFELFELLRRIRTRSLDVLVELLVRTPRLEPVDRLVDRDAINPAEKLPVAVVAREMLESFHERLLADFPRILGIADHVQHGVEHRPLIPRDQLTECVGITLQAALHRDPVQVFLLLNQVQVGSGKVGVAHAISKI